MPAQCAFAAQRPAAPVAHPKSLGARCQRRGPLGGVGRLWRGSRSFCNGERPKLPPTRAQPLPSSWELQESWEAEGSAITAEDELEDWFEDDGPGGDIQEAIAIALAALLLAGTINIGWRLLVVCISVASTAFKYSAVALLLLFFVVVTI
ncbi:unnamed protein product [Ostreobium quekettii]|uniref:Uncharacterized protein n=1 Tax=Ostreobium quekettii TaxID=121088 RepID=A0A8S1IU41_9CHLO|nr:unnamed protein product [Ostreobium quekettii]